MLQATNPSRLVHADEATPEKPRVPSHIPKMTDYWHRVHSTFDRGTRGVCSGRVLEEAGHTPVIVMGEHLDNLSTSVTNMAELLAAELIQWHFPRRFDHEPPAILLEHYPTEYSPQGRVARKPTWDRLSFRSWAPRQGWLGGQERLAFGEPEWRSVPEHEVEALLGGDETRATPPAPKQGDQPGTACRLGSNGRDVGVVHSPFCNDMPMTPRHVMGK